jgi:hypothetical protein
VHTTYNEILKYPFSNGYYTPVDISSVIGYDKQLYQQSIYKGADGVIYTERNEPAIIKYLKVIDNNTKDYYTLYGNSRYNSFECPRSEEKECIIYSDTGNDSIVEGAKYLNISVKDFANNNDKDKLYVDNGSETLFLHDFTVTPEYKDGNYGMNLTIQYAIKNDGKSVVTEEREVFLPNHTLEEVEGWVDIATGEYRDTEEGKKLTEDYWLDIQENNPIQIK